MRRNLFLLIANIGVPQPVAGQEPPEENVDDKPAKFFERIRASHQFQTCEDEEKLEVKVESQDGSEAKGDPEIVSETRKIVEDEADDRDSAWYSKFMPRAGRITLGEALRDHENLESATDDLWRLLFWLRSGPSGSDVAILPKCMLSRQRVVSKGTKWHNELMHRMCLMEASSREPALRQGRQAAWVGHLEERRSKKAPSLPSSLEMEQGDVVCARFGKDWQVGVVLSLWRYCKSQSGGGQLTAQKIPRGCMISARIVCSLSCFPVYEAKFCFVDNSGPQDTHAAF